MSDIQQFENKEALAVAAAEAFVTLSREAIAARGRFTVALSGGSTPRIVYLTLASDFADQVDWPNVHVFWGDERAVPPNHVDSNYRMAMDTLLHHVDVPEKNIHRIKTENKPDEAAAAYIETLATAFDESPPRFDLMFLGMGDDGHTASLFPETTALNVTDQTVASNFVQKFETWRVTLTMPVINAAREIIFLICGEGKATTLNSVLNETSSAEQFPVKFVRPTDGRVRWFVDAPAASAL